MTFGLVLLFTHKTMINNVSTSPRTDDCNVHGLEVSIDLLSVPALTTA